MIYNIHDIVEFTRNCNKQWIGLKAIVTEIKRHYMLVKPLSVPIGYEKWKDKVFSVNNNSIKLFKPLTNRNGANE